MGGNSTTDEMRRDKRTREKNLGCSSKVYDV
jgi:hypothetical protein